MRRMSECAQIFIINYDFLFILLHFLVFQHFEPFLGQQQLYKIGKIMFHLSFPLHLRDEINLEHQERNPLTSRKNFPQMIH